MFNRLRLTYTHYTLLLCASLLMLAGFVWFEQRLSSNANEQLKLAYKNAQQTIIDKELACIDLIQGLLTDTNNLQRNWSSIIDIAEKKNVILTIYKNDTLQIWTSNVLNSDDAYQIIPNGAGFIRAKNGYYVTYKYTRGSYAYLFYSEVKTRYPFRNQYIENQFDPELGFIKEGFIFRKPLKNFVDIHSLNNTYLFSLQIFSFTEKTPDWLIGCILFSILLLLISAHILTRHYIQLHLWPTTILFWGLFIYLRWLNIFFHFPDFFYEYKLFQPQIYASSAWFPSLGDFLINSLLALWYMVILESRTGNRHFYTKSTPTLFWIKFSVYILFCFVGAHLAVSFIKSLTIDSQISFNINDVFTINLFTYLGLVVCIILSLIVYFIARNFIRFVNKQRVSLKVIVTVLVAIFTCYILLAGLLLEQDHFHTLVTVLLLSSFFVFKSLRLKLNRFQQYFVVIFTISFVSSISINHWLNIKELENRKLFAAKLVSQNDITTDYFLRNVEKKIESDNYVVDYFQNPILVKSQFEKRIRQLYFTGYLSKFEVSILDYDTLGYFFKQKSTYTFNQINKLYKNNSIETINTNFRYLNDKANIKGYLGKFDIRKNGEKVGYIFILLQPKLIQDENRFDELLIDGFRQNKRKNIDYSYAVYKDKNLVYQSGDYPYRIKNTWGETNNDFRAFTENNYDHLLYTDEQPLTIIISKQSDSLIQTIGLFSFIFTFCTITLILILFVYVGLNAQFLTRWPFFKTPVLLFVRNIFNRLLMIDNPDILYIRTRIQTSIIFIVFITLLFTSYFTISFITQKYNSRQTERLMKKLRNVVLTVENENIYSGEYENNNELGAFINQIADFYDTDITLFDVDGKVMASSISKIYDEGVVSSMMHPLAYYHLKLLRESQFSQDENIALLNFQAAYAPVFKNKSEVLGYLQLPYFNQQADLLAEISSVIVGFINLYVLLFIIIGVIAYLVSRNISYPLTLIQQKLSSTVLGGKNELINWQRDDEIGELVKQYNHMIGQLEESARKLAETEREGAWREIARQIAHEIKNPLTPMKLSIQHLQRAFKNNDANIEDKLNRTTTLLINQIDTLSELANEFSSFAKMPAPNYDQINVEQALREMVSLYSLSTHANITLHNTVTGELYFDPSYFSRSIGNIIKNAAQAIPEEQEGFISIEASENTESIIIVVKDNGSGMTEEQAADIFKPYFSTKISGMGLGLPIVKSMIESGGGNISFHSVYGEGTTFTILLPKLAHSE
jgi:two-component system, NtrC family, nitrogen regulation sensor histidine kinase NtrY